LFREKHGKSLKKQDLPVIPMLKGRLERVNLFCYEEVLEVLLDLVGWTREKKEKDGIPAGEERGFSQWRKRERAEGVRELKKVR